MRELYRKNFKEPQRRSPNGRTWTFLKLIQLKFPIKRLPADGLLISWKRFREIRTELYLNAKFWMHKANRSNWHNGKFSCMVRSIFRSIFRHKFLPTASTDMFLSVSDSASTVQVYKIFKNSYKVFNQVTWFFNQRLLFFWCSRLKVVKACGKAVGTCRLKLLVETAGKGMPLYQTHLWFSQTAFSADLIAIS